MRTWLLGGSLLALLAGAAVAQNPGVGGINLASPAGTEQINAANTGPQVTWVYLDQVRDAVGYNFSSPTSGTVTFAAGQSEVGIYGGTTISTLTVDLTIAPVDGQRNCFWTKPAVSTLTMTVASGQTLNDGITSTSATTRHCWVYSLSNTTWNRTQ